MSKTSTPETVETTLLYIGRKVHAPEFHYYIRQDTGEEVAFKGTKLHKSHEIGDLYRTTITNGTSFSRSKEYAGTWEKAADIAEWVRRTEEVSRGIKARRERGKLTAEARKAAETIKAMYNRAAWVDRAAMIRVFIETLEK